MSEYINKARKLRPYIDPVSYPHLTLPTKLLG